MIAQQGALFEVIASKSGWLAGLTSPSGCGAQTCDDGNGNAEDPCSSKQPHVASVPEGHTGSSPPTQTMTVQLRRPCVAGVAQTAAAGVCVPDVAGDDVLSVSFPINDVAIVADPVLFERSQRHFVSVAAHR